MENVASAEYRKYKNGFEYMKMKDGVVLSVYNTETATRIVCSGTSHRIQDFRSNIISMESNEKEFARAMHRALQQIAKTAMSDATSTGYKDENKMPGAAASKAEAYETTE